MLFFGVATSIDLFQTKLSRDAIQALDGRAFNVEQVDVEKLFAVIHAEPNISETDTNDYYDSETRIVWLGPALSKSMMDRQGDYIQSPFSFKQALKVSVFQGCGEDLTMLQYVYMSHFFSNPLSLALGHTRDSVSHWQKEHLECVRNLSSFRR